MVLADSIWGILTVDSVERNASMISSSVYVWDGYGTIGENDIGFYSFSFLTAVFFFFQENEEKSVDNQLFIRRCQGEDSETKADVKIPQILTIQRSVELSPRLTVRMPLARGVGVNLGGSHKQLRAGEIGML